MALVGNLRDFNLADFLYLVDRGYKTGRLTLKRSDDAATLYFEKGKLVYATQYSREERLGEMLVRIGRITEQQRDHALRLQQGPYAGKPLGAILVELGYISDEELKRHVRTQIEETVYRLFTWSDGEFRFDAGVLVAPEDVMITLPLGVENIIMEGVRRIDEWSRIRDRIPSTDVVVKFVDQPSDRAKGVNLTPDEWRVFARINGKDSIRTISERTGLGEFEVCRIIYGFISAGLVELVKERPPLPPGLSAPVPAERPKRSLINRIIERIRGM
ncbi:MAG: DUF4388 domain-containing protein [Chloroflexia bacterium]